MGMLVTVQDQSSTGRTVNTIRLEDIPAGITLRDLIRTRVRDEVARYNAAPSNVFVGLVDPEGAERTSAGVRLAAPRRIDWEVQARHLR